MPHAWTAGAKRQLLRGQLVAMEDAGTVVIGIALPPFCCPPRPYERIPLIAHYLKTEKPKSKIMVLDAQDAFAKQDLFEEAWVRFYPGLIGRVPVADSGAVVSVDPAVMRVLTGFDDITAAAANIIPPQKAAQIVIDAGLDGGLGWCPVEPVGFESTVALDVYILRDAAIPRCRADRRHAEIGLFGECSGQDGRLCHVAKLRGETTKPTKLINVCYSLGAPDWCFPVQTCLPKGQTRSRC